MPICKFCHWEDEQNEQKLANEEERLRVYSRLPERKKKQKSDLDIICPRRMPTNVQELSRALTQKKEKESYIMNMFSGVEEILLHHFFYPPFPSPH